MFGLTSSRTTHFCALSDGVDGGEREEDIGYSSWCEHMARRLQLCEGGVEVCEKFDEYGDGGRSEEGVCEQRDTGDFELARESDAV